MVAALVTLGAAAAAWVPTPPLHAAPRRLPNLAACTRPPRSLPAMFFGAPAEITDKLKGTNSGTGKGLASQKEIDAIWSAFERCYGSRERALKASRTNAQVLLPFINTPATITGANRALVELFGKQGALEIISKNPGVLACNPASLARTPKADIERAANLVSAIDNAPANVRVGIPFLTALGLPALVGARAVQCGGGRSCGGVDEWDLHGGFGPQLIDFLTSLVQQVS